MMSKPFQPKNTQQSTSWGLKTFTAWVEERNKHKFQDKWSYDVLRTAKKLRLPTGLDALWRRHGDKTDSLIRQDTSRPTYGYSAAHQDYET